MNKNHHAGIWIAVLAMIALLVIADSWEWLQKNADGNTRTGETNSETLRNVGLLVGAGIGLIVAVWRSRVAERQAATAERGLSNERYQQAAGMLGSATLAVRLAGIYALRKLAQEHRENYHVQVMVLLCAFVRHPTETGDRQAVPPDGTAAPELRADVQAVMDAFHKGTRTENIVAFERERNFHPDLINAHLEQADLREANLTNAILMDAKLKNVLLWDANLEGADLTDADLTDADLKGADLTDVNLEGADLTDANLTDANLEDSVLARAILTETLLWNAKLEDVRGLTQVQIDAADHEMSGPLGLEGAYDADTGEPLKWR